MQAADRPSKNECWFRLRSMFVGPAWLEKQSNRVKSNAMYIVIKTIRSSYIKRTLKELYTPM